jgi:hypothetical protein
VESRIAQWYIAGLRAGWSLVDCLTLWIEFKVKIILDVEGSDEHYLHLWFRHANFLGSWACLVFPLQNFVVCSRGHVKNTAFYLQWSFFAFFPNFIHNLMFRCSKNCSLIFATRRRNTRVLSATQLALLMHRNRNLRKLKHAQTCLYYDQVTQYTPVSGYAEYKEENSK